MSGKITRLPKSIREQLNRRLENGEPGPRLLRWLNSLPEVQTVLATDFASQPICKQNLNQYTKRAFRAWKMRQHALEFVAPDDPNPAPADPASTGQLTDKLIHWLALCFAATAHSLAPHRDTSEPDLRRLRNFAADIIALRRGDLCTRRVAVEEKRLALLETASQDKREKQFWEWTKRPDIAEKLGFRRLKTQEWHDLLRLLVPEVALFLPDDDEEDADQTETRNRPDETLHPAALI